MIIILIYLEVITYNQKYIYEHFVVAEGGVLEGSGKLVGREANNKRRTWDAVGYS